MYFYYDINGLLLYVGLSSDIYRRFLNHMNDKTWAHQINGIGYREYPNKRTMDFAEQYYIGKLKPKYNITGNSSDELFLDMNDPSREIIMDKKSFTLKYSNFISNNTDKKNHVLSKRTTIENQFLNDGWEIIKKVYY